VSRASPDPKTAASLTSHKRTAILEATIQLVAAHGFAGTTVGAVTKRAGVSRRTFYELFGSLEDCFVVVLDAGAQQVASTILSAFQAEAVWVDGIRSALAALLVLFEADPARARLWHVETLAAGQWALERRQCNLAALRTQIVEYWYPADPDDIAVASDGVIAALLGMLHTRLLTRSDEPLLELLGPLMGLAVAPFVDPDTQAREIGRSERLAQEILAGRPPASLQTVLSRHRRRPLVLGPRIPRSAHMRRCLIFLAGSPGSSNSEIAAALGIAHPSQISRLLNQLADRGLVARRSRGLGKRNEWMLTAVGQVIADLR
jgi:AcrR family transcriptional regulator